jgi:hypothetical protein
MLPTECQSGMIESTGGSLNVFYVNIFADRSSVSVVAFRQHLGALKSFNCINGHDRGLFFYLSGSWERKGGTILSLKPFAGVAGVEFLHRFYQSVLLLEHNSPQELRQTFDCRAVR